MIVQQLPRLALRLSLVLAPLLWLLSAPLAAGATASGDAATVAEIAHHPGRYYLFTLLTLVGTMLLVPALVRVSELARVHASLAAFVGAGLAQLGALVGVADSGTQLVYWQTRGGDPAQMAGLLHRYESAPGSNLVFMVGGLSLIAGSLLLAFALRRSRLVPSWAIACLPLGMVANIAAFAAQSRLVLAASSLILLAGFVRFAAGPVATAVTPAPAPA